MIIPGIFIILFGLFFALIGFKFLTKPEQTIKRMQEIKYKSSSQPAKQAVITTRVLGVILLLIGIYFIGLGINVLIN